jgi:membrane protein DedA with SNARE-associated domain
MADLAQTSKHPNRPLQVAGAAALWAVGSTAIGYVAAHFSNFGHGSLLFLYAAWLIGALGFVFHLVYIMRRQTDASNEQAI